MIADSGYYLNIGIFLAAFFLSLICSKISIQLAKTIGLIDIPNLEAHKVHRKAIPIAGGLVIFLTLLPLLAFGHFSGLFQIDYFLVAAFLLIFVVGILDDMTRLSAKTKLLGQIAVSLIIVCGNHHAVVFDTNFLNITFSVIWYVGIMNAFNFIDSADGLLIGICIVIASSIFFATLQFPQANINLLSIGVLGILFGLYLNNKKPAKLFLGDSGSLLLGLLFALVVLKFNPLGFDPTTSWISPILMMSFPIFDTALVVFCRWREKKPIYRAGLDHTFHRLRRYFKKEKGPYFTIYGVTILSNIFAIVNLFLAPKLSFTLFGILLSCGVMIILIFEKFLPAENV
jgi:UDP-GlcNAc:undecaprenyl-phosphate GlcNAc-1-phosphate transferase